MEVRIEVPEQIPGGGQRYAWDDGYELTVTWRSDGTTVVTGNGSGLRTLAGHLLVLSMPEVGNGSHLHLDESTGLDPGSDELILQRSDGGEGKAHC